jgi:alkanesulfonate monooxygenase SsuD/methylene tetrahydromethanopterin reductase-like flavin-dependent oxidoreductase (luciferase family)
MRAPDFGPSEVDLYRAAVDISEWAEALGFDSVTLNEHHNTVDGYLPSPMVLGAGIATRTTRVQLEIAALVVTLHHPLRVAEDLAVLDLLSNGRLSVVLGQGYRRPEFEMFGVDWRKRPSLIEEAIVTLRDAWTGEPFEFRGHTVQVRPRPAQPDGPPLALAGASEASAKRAARLGMPYQPINQHFLDVYLAELERLGTPVPEHAYVDPFVDRQSPNGVRAPAFLHIANDPEAAWKAVAPHALHHTNTYASWAQRKDLTPFQAAEDAEVLRADGSHQVLTPDETIELFRALGPDGRVRLMPLLGGIPPDLAWGSLRLLEDEVLPEFASG